MIVKKMPGLLEEQSPSAGEQSQAGQSQQTGVGGGATLPKGVVLGKDGKPCRTCTSSAAWMAMMKSSGSPSSSSSSATTSNNNSSSKSTSTNTSKSISPSKFAFPPVLTNPSTAPTASTTDDCPPDVESLGRSTWTLLHSLTATYPSNPPPAHQHKTHSFLTLFAQLYPCWVCAEDFQSWMAEPQNNPVEALKTQESFGRWMCAAHNAVNQKLGKEDFNCDLWRERWKDGWKDGRCN